MRWLFVVGTDSLATRSEFAGEIRQTPLQPLDAVGEEAHHLIEIVNRPILERNSALELHDSLVHRRIVLARIYIAFHDGAVVTEDGVEFPYPPDPGIRLIR
jgi:hypothetical protein